MKSDAARNRMLLPIIIAYALIAMGWNLHYSSVSHDEAINILMGGQMLNGQSCPYCAQNTGSVLIHPLLAYLGDSAGGLAGARIVSIIFGIGLVLATYATTKILYSEKLAFFAALLLLFTGTVIYLSKLATYDMAAAFFLALSLLMIIQAEITGSSRRTSMFLVAASVSLFVAGITKYIVAAFWIPLALYVFWKHKFARGFVFFLLPLLIAGSLYAYLAILPAMHYLAGSATTPYKEGHLGLFELSSRIFRWLSIPYILSFFSFFHQRREWGKRAMQLFLLSTPAMLLQLMTGDGRSLDKNVIFSLVFLAPCAVIGLDHMGDLFTTNSPDRWVKSFFTALLLLVIWAFGLTDLTWLQKHFPDVTPVIDFLDRKGFDGMTVAIDSDYGDSDNIYRYSLGRKYPGARFYSTSYITTAERKSLVSRVKPDFLLFDEYYSSEPLRDKLRRYSDLGYFQVEAFTVQLPWGNQTIQILHRR